MVSTPFVAGRPCAYSQWRNVLDLEAYFNQGLLHRNYSQSQGLYIEDAAAIHIPRKDDW